MQLKFGTYHEAFGAELLCPACGSINLHHHRVEVFERSEDAPSGLHVTVEASTMKADTVLKGNPSRRRDGLTIELTCESCPAVISLVVQQHKGSTYVDLTFQEGEPAAEV